MSFRFTTFCLAIVFLAGGRVCGQTPARPVRNKPADAPAAKTAPAISREEQEAFNVGKDLDESGNAQQAISAYRGFIRKYPVSPLSSKAQFRIAEVLESLGEPSKAFDEYQTLLTRYPDTSEFEKAVTKQVVIANQFLSGAKLSFLGMKVVPATERAEQMFGSILKNAPFSKNASVAQFNLGLTYEKQGKSKEAAAAYQTVLDKYTNSPIAADALYQIGYLYMQLGRSGRSQDLSALVLAKNTFEDFLLQYPNSEKAAQARDNLVSLGGKESGDLMAIAKFYDRYRDFRAAAIYYNDVIRRKPKGKDAEFAKERIQALRSDLGDDALRTGPEHAETGEKALLRRRLQAQIETSALPDFNGPPRRDIVPDELPVVTKPKFRTDVREVRPMPAVEPALPNQ